MAKKTFELQVMRTDPNALTTKNFADTFEHVFRNHGADFFLRLRSVDGAILDEWFMVDEAAPSSPQAVMSTDNVKYSIEPVFAEFYVQENIQDWQGDAYPVRLVATAKIPAQWKAPPGVFESWAPRILIGLGVVGAVAGGVALAKKAKVL